MLQSMAFQGLFPEIHRAWVTVDNVLYIWDYHTEGEGEGGREEGEGGEGGRKGEREVSFNRWPSRAFPLRFTGRG